MGEVLAERHDDATWLRTLWDEGKASGAVEPFDVERTLEAARARLKSLAVERPRFSGWLSPSM